MTLTSQHPTLYLVNPTGMINDNAQYNGPLTVQ